MVTESMYSLSVLCIVAFVITASGESIDLDKYVHQFLNNYYPDKNAPISLSKQHKEELVNIVLKVIRSHLGMELVNNGIAVPSSVHIKKYIDDFLEERARKHGSTSTTAHTISTTFTTFTSANSRKLRGRTSTTPSTISTTFPTFSTEKSRNNWPTSTTGSSASTTFNDAVTAGNCLPGKNVVDTLIDKLLTNYSLDAAYEPPLSQSAKEELVALINFDIHSKLGRRVRLVRRSNATSHVSLSHISRCVDDFYEETDRNQEPTSTPASTVSTTFVLSTPANFSEFKNFIDNYIDHILEDNLLLDKSVHLTLSHSRKENLVTLINNTIYNQLGMFIRRSNGTSYVSSSHINKRIDDFLKERARNYRPVSTTTSTISTTLATTANCSPGKSVVDSYIQHLLTGHYAHMDPKVFSSQREKEELVTNITRMIREAGRNLLPNGFSFPSLSHINKCIDYFLEERARNHRPTSTVAPTISTTSNIVTTVRDLQHPGPDETITGTLESMYPDDKRTISLTREDKDMLIFKIYQKMHSGGNKHGPTLAEVTKDVDEFFELRGQISEN